MGEASDRILLPVPRTNSALEKFDGKIACVSLRIHRNQMPCPLSVNMRLATAVFAGAFAGGFVGTIISGQYIRMQSRKAVRPLEKLEIQANYMEKFGDGPRHTLWNMIVTQLQQQSFGTGRAVHLKLPFSTSDSLQAVKNATFMMGGRGGDKVAIQTATVSYSFSSLSDSTVDGYLNTHVWGTSPSVWGQEKNFTDQLPDAPVFLFITDEEEMFMDENLPVLNRVCAGTQLAIVVITYDTGSKQLV